MQLPVIKHLAETFNIEQLVLAEQQLLNEEPLQMEVEGKDEGEKLTHIIAAKAILEEVRDHGIDLRTAIRQYAQRVRNSIS